MNINDLHRRESWLKQTTLSGYSNSTEVLNVVSTSMSSALLKIPTIIGLIVRTHVEEGLRQRRLVRLS